jgi:hypothetical protein
MLAGLELRRNMCGSAPEKEQTMSPEHEHDVPDRPPGLLAHPSNHRLDVPALELTGCPACDQPAEILNRFVLESTAGPLEHVKIRCVLEHGFVLPIALLNALHLG